MKKQYILFFCMLFGAFSYTFSQSDTIKWGEYLYISTKLPGKFDNYEYEYKDIYGKTIIPKGKYCYLSTPDEQGMIIAERKINRNCGSNRDSSCGYIDIHENILIPFIYSGIDPFKCNVAMAVSNGKFGYINRKGEKITDFIYDSYAPFHNGVALPEIHRIETIGIGAFYIRKILIDTLGKKIMEENAPYESIESRYESIKANFPYDDFLWIKSNGKYAFFDTKGQQLTPFIFDKMHPSSVCSYETEALNCLEPKWFYNELVVIETESQYAVLNQKMEYVVPFGVYDWISPISIGGLLIVKQQNLYGLLNTQLEFVQPIEFEDISNKPTLLYEQDSPSFLAKKNNKYYIFDTLGRWKDFIEYDSVRKLQANSYLVFKKGEPWRVDRNGNRIFENFTVIREDRDGFVAKRNSLLGFIDRNGNTILPFEYEDIIAEHLGNFYVKQNGKWGVVNYDNEQLLACQYNWIKIYRNKDKQNCYVVVLNDKFGKITDKGKVVFPCVYDGITTWVEYGPNGHYVMIDNKMGLIDENGEELVPIKYESVSCVSEKDLAVIYNKGKMGIYSIKNKSFLLPLEYDFLYVDYDLFVFEEKPIKIITRKANTINILDEKGNIIEANVSKERIDEEYKLGIDIYQNYPCSYELDMMTHNKTFKAPDCLLKKLEKKGSSSESIYYNMSAQ